jgi:hypothetical protein
MGPKLNGLLPKSLFAGSAPMPLWNISKKALWKWIQLQKIRSYRHEQHGIRLSLAPHPER